MLIHTLYTPLNTYPCSHTLIIHYISYCIYTEEAQKNDIAEQQEKLRRELIREKERTNRLLEENKMFFRRVSDKLDTPLNIVAMGLKLLENNITRSTAHTPRPSGAATGSAGGSTCEVTEGDDGAFDCESYDQADSVLSMVQEMRDNSETAVSILNDRYMYERLENDLLNIGSMSVSQTPQTPERVPKAAQAQASAQSTPINQAQTSTSADRNITSKLTSPRSTTSLNSFSSTSSSKGTPHPLAGPPTSVVKSVLGRIVTAPGDDTSINRKTATTAASALKVAVSTPSGGSNK